MMRFDFTKDEYEILRDRLMLNDELATIFEMKIRGYSIVEMSMKLNMSESTIKRRVKEIRNKLEKVL